MEKIFIPHIIPLLPSPHFVFFPKTHLSLHVPRFVYNCIRESGGLVDCFVGTVLINGHLVSDESTIMPIGCVGKVVHYCFLPCGRAVHLDLYGLKRFQMKEAWFEEGYGQAWIETIEDQRGTLSLQ